MDKIVIFILVFLILILLCLFRSEYEKKHFKKVIYTIKSAKIKKQKNIIFLSDLHNNSYSKNNERLIRAIDELNPDMVLIGGDMMTAKGLVDLEPSLLLCAGLKAKYPVYYGNGNHELKLKYEPYNLYGSFVESMKDIGVELLEDRSIELDDMVISGLDIDREYYKKVDIRYFEADYIEKKLGKVNNSKFSILLGHSPIFLEAYADWGADLVLSGHFHGGTIRLFGVGLMTPQIQFFNSMVHGIKKKDNTTMIISSGLGTHSVNLRLNARPELILIQLRGED